jgi:hypothetical protein
MLTRSQLPLAVAHADVAADTAFHSAADYFHSGEVDREWWKEVRNLAQVVEPLTLSERALVIVEGDVRADIRLADGGMILVYGDLHSSIEMNDHAELIVAGNVSEAASILVDGIQHVFVGGDCAGRFCSLGSCKLWVEGNLSGRVLTGDPVTRVRVGGDCDATIAPSDEPALLFLDVTGFMSYELLKATAAMRYTQFNASIGISDRLAGLYPENGVELLKHSRSYNRWVIRSAR